MFVFYFFLFSVICKIRLKDKRSDMISFKKRFFEILTTFTHLFFIENLQGLLQPAVDLFFCINVRDSSKKLDKYLVISDLSLEYYSQSNQNFKSYLSLPFISVLVLIPILLLIKIVRAHSNNTLSNSKFLSQYGIFYFAYNKRFYFFEFVIIAKKLLLIPIRYFLLYFFIYDNIETGILIILMYSFI